MLPVVAKTVSSNSEAYDYLNESIRDWPDQRTLMAWIRQAGWGDVAYRNLTGGIVALHLAGMLNLGLELESLVDAFVAREIYSHAEANQAWANRPHAQP